MSKNSLMIDGPDSLADTVGSGDHPVLVHQDRPAPVADVPHNRVPELDGNLNWDKN